MNLMPDRGGTLPDAKPQQAGSARLRIKLADLLRQMREIEIEHEGKVYLLRLTQSNKLILTA